MLKSIIAFAFSGLILVLAFVQDNWFDSQLTADRQATELNFRLKKLVVEIEQQAEQLLSKNVLDLQATKFPFYLADSIHIIQWNAFEFLPDLRILQDNFEWKFYQHQRGQFLIYKKKAGKTTFLISYIPLHTRFSISNRYLSDQWNDLLGTRNGMLFHPPDEPGVPVVLNDSILFTLSLSPQSDEPANPTATILFMAFLISFAIGVILLMKYFSSKRKYLLGFLSLLFTLVSIRILLLWLNVPRRWTNSPVFDPQIFASSNYNISVGDLLLNTVIVLSCCAYVAFNFHRFGWVQKLKGRSTSFQYFIGFFFLLACYFSFLFPFLFIETLSHNSAIALDITQSLQVDLVRVVAWLSILIGAITAFCMIHVLITIVLNIFPRNKTLIFLLLIGAALAFAVIGQLGSRDYLITTIIGAVYLTSLIVRKYFPLTEINNQGIFLYLVLTVIAFSLQSAWATRRFSEEKLIEAQFRFGRNFLVSRDVLGEYLLDQASQRIARDPFIQSRLSTPFLNQSAIKNKINQIYLSGYFDRYEVNIHLFSASGKRLDNPSLPDMVSAIQEVQTNSNKTNYEGIYFINPTTQFIRKYFSITAVNRAGNPVGFVVLELYLKKVIPNSVYPELLVDNRFSQFFTGTKFSYAFYNNQALELSYGDFNYNTSLVGETLTRGEIYTQGIALDGALHAAIEDDYGRVVVIGSKVIPVSFIIANFSFYFVLSVALLFFLLLIYLLLKHRSVQLTYSQRIQLYIYAAFVIPLLVVSFAVLTALSENSHREIKNEFRERARVFADQVSASLSLNQDASEPYPDRVEKGLSELTRSIAMDASVYDTSGMLLTSTQPLIFEQSLLSTLINPIALTGIVRLKESTVITDERIGSLDYSNAYAALKDPTSGAIIGILSLPFFDSLSSFEQTQINTLALMLAIFVLTFIVFSFVSAYAVAWLIFPLQYITKSLKATTFQGRNKKMEWKNDDEIGWMVREYNQMVDNLEQSKQALARTQKETAWREMAQQVAHEIKNPLTPMKLTLQQLQMLLQNNQIDKERLSQSMATLLTQVDILNEIASSFNTFARMPAPVLHPLELKALLKKTISLYTREEVSIHINLEDEIWVMGDDQLLSRIFSNLILNGMQSVRTGVKPEIKISIRVLEAYCELSFQDNGEGIDPSIRDKVFVPHFSTKKSGSGLGLAIARQGIEQSGGSIWFETEMKEGTTFYLQLLLASEPTPQ